MDQKDEISDLEFYKYIIFVPLAKVKSLKN